MKSKRTKNEIKITVGRRSLDDVYCELFDFVMEFCEKHDLSYYELFGLFESLKLNLNQELYESEA